MKCPNGCPSPLKVQDFTPVDQICYCSRCSYSRFSEFNLSAFSKEEKEKLILFKAKIRNYHDMS